MLANDLIRSGKVPKYEAPNQLGTYLMRCVNLWCKISCLSNRVTFGSGTSSCVRCIPLLWHRVSYFCLHELNPCLDKQKQWYCGDYSLFVAPGQAWEVTWFFTHLKKVLFPFSCIYLQLHRICTVTAYMLFLVAYIQEALIPDIKYLCLLSAHQNYPEKNFPLEGKLLFLVV